MNIFKPISQLVVIRFAVALLALAYGHVSFGQVPNPAGPIPLVQTVPLTNAIYGRIGITNMMLLVRGDNVIGDGGGGVFAWLHGDTNTADNARYFAATNGGNWYKISYWDDGTGGGGGGGGLGTNGFVNGVLFQPIMFTNNLSSDVGRLVWYTNANGHVVGYATNVASATTPSFVAAASSAEITNAYFQATTDIFYNVSGTNIQAYLVTEAVEDLIGASLVAGSNITISYDDGGTGKTTIAGISSGATNGTPVNVDGGSTLVAANFTDTTGINFGVSGTNVTANLTDRNWGDITTSSSGTSVAINANSVVLGTDTTGNYIATIAGTANEVDASGSGSETAGVIVSLPATIDLGGKTSLEVPNAAAPTVDAFGEVAGDNDAWAAGRGALLFYDGTASTRLVGVLSSDTPSNGQVPKWNTGGTITWEDDSTGVGGSGTIVTVDGGADNTRVNLADTTGIGVTLSGTNASFALVDRDFGAVTVSSSGTAIALDDGTVTSNKVVAANITIDKLSASGTPLSTNFLAGDYAWKQVTTNMIPGLNAVLATIGSGGGGSGTNAFVNGVLMQPFRLTNNASDTGRLVWYTNASGDVLGYATNISSSGGGGLGTNLFVNNILSQPAKLTNSTTIVWSTNSNGDIVATATNVTGTTTDNVWQVWGGADFVITNNASTGDIKASTLTYSGGITNATLIGNTGSGDPAIVRFDFASRNTNYFVVLEIESENGASFAVGGLNYNTKSANSFQIWLTAPFAADYSGGYWTRVRMLDQVSVGGSGGDVTQSGNNTFTGTNTFSGTTTFNNLSIGTITVVSNLTVPNNAYGAGWNGSTNVPNENSVYDEMELRAPKASPAFTTSATIGGTNILDYAASHLTEAEASALYQRTNSTLTRVAGIGAGTTGDLLYRDATGWTNLAKGAQGQYLAVTATVPAWSNAPSGGGTWDGTPIASGTITNLTTQSITYKGRRMFNPMNGDWWADGYFKAVAGSATFYPLGWNAMASGSLNGGNGTANHPVTQSIYSSASVDSGGNFRGDLSDLLIGGGETAIGIMQITRTNGVVLREGFHDGTSSTEPTDGVYMEMANGYFFGKTASNGTRSTTTSSNRVVQSTWYTLISELNTAASTATFTQYDDSGTVVWTDTLSANIPTGAGRFTTRSCMAYIPGGGAFDLVLVDGLGVLNQRVLTRYP